MARLNEASCSDEEFPELSTILHSVNRSPMKPAGGRIQKEQGSKSIACGKDGSSPSTDQSTYDGIFRHPKSATKSSCDGKQPRKQRPLRLAHVNSLLSTTKEKVHKSYDLGQYPDSKQIDIQQLTPRRTGRTLWNRNKFASVLKSKIGSEDDQSSDGLSDFIVDDSTSDDEDVRVRVRLRTSKQQPRNDSSSTEGRLVSKILQPTIIDLSSPKKATLQSSTIDLDSPKKAASTLRSTNSTSKTIIENRESWLSESLFEGQPPAFLRFSPTVSGSPHRILDEDRPVTPPSSPPKFRLQSPSKKDRIPPSPHRPSIDAFWSQEVINDWNDHYSPRKTPKHGNSSRMVSVSEDEEFEHSPSGSPRKSPSKRPVNLDKEAIQRRKIFNEKKNGLAISFLKDLDQKITNGQVGILAAAAGGIHIIWSKKLNSTAGRASWKREGTHSKSTDGTVSTTYRHHASIELAEKVVDDENRLLNVIAHEYCHLANFMINGVKDNPHGKEFKEWAHKVTTAFSHLNIHVTTKHTYAISYKYIWACTEPACGVEYQRHSRSIDPGKHSCGKCRGKLVQVKPPPRASAKGADPKVSNESPAKGRYQEYVKLNFAPVRSENPSLGMADLMVLLGKRFREERARLQGGAAAAAAAAAGDEDGDRYRDGNAGGEGTGLGIGAVDSVARKLDFLSLG